MRRTITSHLVDIVKNLAFLYIQMFCVYVATLGLLDLSLLGASCRLGMVMGRRLLSTTRRCHSLGATGSPASQPLLLRLPSPWCHSSLLCVPAPEMLYIAHYER